jgi:hypothetical protein
MEDDAVKDEFWEDFFEGEELSWLRAQLVQLRREVDDPCIDNERVAREDLPQSVSLYERQKANGCCGRHDVTVKRDGLTYRMGLNYGH